MSYDLSLFPVLRLQLAQDALDVDLYRSGGEGEVRWFRERKRNPDRASRLLIRALI
ncbi:hypothetical protein [Methylobacterium oxalidis]|uniref:hypothetical protein n=1 Tax=Methylobacterium oxalidis TaxID=944322 RepID=UPI0033151780